MVWKRSGSRQREAYNPASSEIFSSGSLKDTEKQQKKENNSILFYYFLFLIELPLFILGVFIVSIIFKYSFLLLLIFFNEDIARAVNIFAGILAIASICITGFKRLE